MFSCIVYLAYFVSSLVSRDTNLYVNFLGKKTSTYDIRLRRKLYRLYRRIWCHSTPRCVRHLDREKPRDWEGVYGKYGINLEIPTDPLREKIDDLEDQNEESEDEEDNMIDQPTYTKDILQVWII